MLITFRFRNRSLNVAKQTTIVMLSPSNLYDKFGMKNSNMVVRNDIDAFIINHQCINTIGPFK